MLASRYEGGMLQFNNCNNLNFKIFGIFANQYEFWYITLSNLPLG